MFSSRSGIDAALSQLNFKYSKEQAKVKEVLKIEAIYIQKEDMTVHTPTITYKAKNNLVPIIAKKDFDKVAQDFLQQYYPKALSEL